eukprot:Nitzschia sp. Nitz4//scaffold31_size150131//139101//141896//NITZ4_002854-RA/size150131-processed-gene-0.147-mRNA-1//-1//CDS//3329547737//1734//frame0
MSKRHRNTRHPEIVALALPPFMKLTCLLVVVALVPIWMFSRLGGSHNDLALHVSQRLGASKNRIAIIIPFVGEGPEAIPPYLELFCTAAYGSRGLVDFLLFHNGVLDGYTGDACPPNVQFISLGSTEEFSAQLTRVVSHKANEEIAVGSRDTLAKILSKHVVKYPYVLVEFKPALGHIFSEYLSQYSHWGYSDLDILFGDLERWITPDELKDFDIVTYGFGDQDRIYLRGQFTFHRNNDKINQLWRKCDYLSDMDKRFASVLSGDSHLHFESAEGCYSAAVLENNDISVKYTVKAFTDINEEDTVYSHGLYVSTGSKKSKTVLYKAGSKSNGKSLDRLADTWFEGKNSLYADPNKPLLYEVGERERIPSIEKNDAKCMFWAQQKYQSRLCLSDVSSTDTVYWINGQLYKQPYQLASLPGKIETAPFFHFQEYKRYYRPSQLAGFHRNGVTRSFVLSKEGVLPLYPRGYKPDRSFVPSPLGVYLRRWHGVKGNSRDQLPNRSYCLVSGPRKFPTTPPAPQCQLRTSWQDQDRVELISGAPLWKHVDVNKEVTLVLTLQILASQASDSEAMTKLLELVGMYLNRWQGQPCVLVINVSGASSKIVNLLRMKLGPDSDLSYYGMDTCLVSVIQTKEDEYVSRKALLNMAIDSVPTRWFVSGFELERGVVVSHDTAFFAHRTARMQEELPGSVFVIPQFGQSNEDGEFTIPSLLKSRIEEKLQALLHFDDGCASSEDMSATSDGSSIFHDMNDVWWKLSEGYVTGVAFEDVDDSVHKQRAKQLDDIQLSIMSLLTDEKHYSLFAMDISPILLTDNLGPSERSGMTTSEIAREVEEFGGKQCYNVLRLVQLATYGYSVNMLPGAFALSTPATRGMAFAGLSDESAPLGASRCDACFMFNEKHEDILEDIAKDERKRPAKAALLWEPRTSQDTRLLHA